MDQVILQEMLYIERIAGIEFEVAGMKDDIAKILAAVTKT